MDVISVEDLRSIRFEARFKLLPLRAKGVVSPPI
jgi:hypothetical protein